VVEGNELTKFTQERDATAVSTLALRFSAPSSIKMMHFLPFILHALRSVTDARAPDPLKPSVKGLGIALVVFGASEAQSGRVNKYLLLPTLAVAFQKPLACNLELSKYSFASPGIAESVKL
jgi:hypothetical protein